MKSLMSLWNVLLADAGKRCCTSIEKDMETCQSRFKDEGVSFLTITLSNFGKDLQRALDQGYIDSNLFLGFKRKGGLPAFLQGFLRHIFDETSGGLLHNPCIDCIHSIRQLTFVFSKVELPCTENRIREAFNSYVQCEQELRKSDSSGTGRKQSLTPLVNLAFAMLFGNVVNGINRELSLGCYDHFLPRHGPGATSDTLVGNQKFYQSEWPRRLEELLPFGDFCLPNWRYFDSEVEFLEPGSERPVRVISVPKTLKRPRIIAIEPTAMQYAQQAILGRLLEGFKRDDYLKNLITIHDQTPNQRMALEGSKDGSLSTVDLSEASDRVSNQLVRGLVAPWPDFLQVLDATRSRSARLPGGEVIRLAKYASMGSALTFPVETMVFMAIVFASAYELSSHKDWSILKKELASRVRVYGDDIVCPTDIVHHVIANLETLGLRVNSDKTFTRGSFRESCGKEYYDGCDVSIVKLTQVFPARRDDASEVVAMVSFRNLLYMQGYWTTCQWLDDRIRRILRHFPILEPTSPGIGRVSVSFAPEGTKEHPDLQKPLIKAYVKSARIPINSVDGSAALLKCFLSGFNPDPEHLERSGRPHGFGIKLRWTPVA